MIEAPALSMVRTASPLPGFLRYSCFSFSFGGCLYSSRVDSVSENRGGGPLKSISLYRELCEISFLDSDLFLSSYELQEIESVVVKKENKTNITSNRCRTKENIARSKS